MLCNTEFDDSSSHKGFKTHVLNLIKSEVVFDQDKKTVYRAVRWKFDLLILTNVIKLKSLFVRLNAVISGHVHFFFVFFFIYFRATIFRR